MFSKVKSCAVHGVDGRMIDVEADVNDGLPVFTMVGYLSSSVRESSDACGLRLRIQAFICHRSASQSIYPRQI